MFATQKGRSKPVRISVNRSERVKVRASWPTATEQQAQPQRKVDIEIAGAVVRVAGGHVSERTASAVEGQDQALANDQQSQPKSPTKFPEPAKPGQSKDRRRHDGPDRRMQ